MRKWFRQNWMALSIIAAVAFAILVCLNGCTKNTTVTGPSSSDTVTVTKVDTVEVQKDIKSIPDFYDALQNWINLQLAGTSSYYPTIGTEDIQVTGSATVKTFDVYWIVIDFNSGEIWAYSGIFEATYQGSGSYTFKDNTPTNMPQLSRGKLATRKL